MSGFHRDNLRRLQRAAGLYPMPAFLRDYGHMLLDEENKDYIDGAYFSPEALRWADAIAEYRARGGKVSVDDEECFARVWKALRAGRRATDAQQNEFDEDSKWKRAEQRIPELFAREMRARGVSYYGPDYELEDGIEGPGSGQELIYRFLFRELGYATRESAKAQHNVWKRKRRDGGMVCASP